MPFLIPESWVSVCLGDVAQYGIPDKVNSNQEITPDTWVLDLEDIEKNTSRLIDQVMSSDRPFRSTKTMFLRGDVLFGKLRPYLNKVVIADTDGICSTEIVPIRGYCGIVPEYTKLVLKSPLTMQRVDRLMYGMKMPRLGTNDAVALVFPLPPLAEQHRIVAKVDALMALCDQLEAAKTEREQSRDRLVAASLHQLQDFNGFTPRRQDAKSDEKAEQENLGTLAPWRESVFLQNFPRLTTRPAHIKQLRQTILNLAVRGKLAPQDPNDEPAADLLNRIQGEKAQLVKEGKIKSEKVVQNRASMSDVSARLPEGWVWTYIQNVCTSVSDGDHLAPPKSETGIPFLVIGNIRSQTIEFAGCRYVPDSYYQKIDTIRRPSKGDVLYTLVGSYGIPVIVRGTRPFCVQRHIGIFRPSKYMNLDFVARFLASKLVFDQATECATGIAQKTVPLAGLRAIKIPLPPLAEQHRIVAKVDELMALCDQLEAQLTTTEADSRRLLEALLHETLSPTQEEAA